LAPNRYNSSGKLFLSLKKDNLLNEIQQKLTNADKLYIRLEIYEEFSFARKLK